MSDRLMTSLLSLMIFSLFGTHMNQPIPTKEQLAVLNPSERRAYRIAHFMTRYLKWVGIAWNLVLCDSSSGFVLGDA